MFLSFMVKKLLHSHNIEAVLLLVHDSENARQVARYAVQNTDFRQWLEVNEFTKMQKIVDAWAKLY